MNVNVIVNVDVDVNVDGDVNGRFSCALEAKTERRVSRAHGSLVLLLLALLFILPPPSRLRAQPPELFRGLVSRDPVTAQAGQFLTLLIQTGSGLTPPPGVQQERALRGFAARLCPVGEAQAAPCTPLEARDVRPRDAHSLAYLVRFALPSALLAGHYDVDVRFPGGTDRMAAGVVIEPRPAGEVAPESARKGPDSAATPTPRVSGGCALGGQAPPGKLWGLLLVALSWKLAAGRRPRVPLE